MGPFVPPRQKADWEITPPPRSLQVAQIVEMLRSRSGRFHAIRTQLHGGQWVGNDDFIQCTRFGCNWRSEGPGGWSNSRAHLDQWYQHRAEMALAEGIV